MFRASSVTSIVTLQNLSAAFKHPDSFRDVESNPGAATDCTSAATPTTIELIVAYTPTVREALEQENRGVNNVIQDAIWQTNLANQDSGVQIAFHAAHIYETKDREDSSMDATLTSFETKHD